MDNTLYCHEYPQRTQLQRGKTKIYSDRGARYEVRNEEN